MNMPSRKVLVVDDEPASQAGTCRALLECGFQCEVASDGEQALQMTTMNGYQAVVTELILPKRSGGELVVKLRGQRRPPIVVVYTRVMEREVHQGLVDEGVDAVFYKPVDPRTLARNVELHLAAREASSRNSSASVNHRLVDALREYDGWIQNSRVRIEIFRFGIMALACILLSLGWGHSLDGPTAGICKMFGLCGLAFFFCLELVAYQRAQSRAKVLRCSVEQRLAQQIEGPSLANVAKPQPLSI
jgi:CheY-like chemotaxis protein